MKLLEEPVNKYGAIVRILLKQHEIIVMTTRVCRLFEQPTSPNHHGRNDSDGSFEHST
jgi:hypothetical protein